MAWSNHEVWCGSSSSSFIIMIVLYAYDLLNDYRETGQFHVEWPKSILLTVTSIDRRPFRHFIFWRSVFSSSQFKNLCGLCSGFLHMYVRARTNFCIRLTKRMMVKLVTANTVGFKSFEIKWFYSNRWLTEWTAKWWIVKRFGPVRGGPVFISTSEFVQIWDMIGVKNYAKLALKCLH